MGALNNWRSRAGLVAIVSLVLVSCGPPGLDESPQNAPNITVKSVVTTKATTTTAVPIYTPADSVARTSPGVTRPSGSLPSHTSPPSTARTLAAATAICNDGTYWYAAQHLGACAQHGGVAVFYR
jgi:Protein of unknown function (DUF3761)